MSVPTGWAAPGGTGRIDLQGVTAQHVDAARLSNTCWLESCTIRLLCVLALDRFCDFTSDQVRHSRTGCLQLVSDSSAVQYSLSDVQCARGKNLTNPATFLPLEQMSWHQRPALLTTRSRCPYLPDLQLPKLRSPLKE